MLVIKQICCGKDYRNICKTNTNRVCIRFWFDCKLVFAISNSVLIKCIFNFHLIVNDYVAHFSTLHSFFSILCCRASPKLLASTNIVFLGLNSKVILLRIDSLGVISFSYYSSIYLRCWYFTKNIFSTCGEYATYNYAWNFYSNELFINSILPS